MVAWSVWKCTKEGGRCPLDDWLSSSKITKRDKVRLEAKISTIEGIEGELPAEILKKYHGTNLLELKVRAEGKQLRPLCHVLPERRIIILMGAFERDGKIPSGDLKKQKTY